MKRLIAVLATASLSILMLVPAVAQADFGLVPGSFTAGTFGGDGAGPLNAGATADTRAGAHPFAASTNFSFNSHQVPVPGDPSLTGAVPDGGTVKDIVVQLPPGFVGNPTAIPQCEATLLIQEGACPNDTVVGALRIRIAINTGALFFPSFGPTVFYLPVYNMEPDHGQPALFGFLNSNPFLITYIHVDLDPQRNYAVTASVPRITGLARLLDSDLTLWGQPVDSAHDPWRGPHSGGGWGGADSGCLVLGNGTSIGSCPSGGPLVPFLSNPTSCTGQPVTTPIHVAAWGNPGSFDANGNPDLTDPAWDSAVATAPPVTGCNALAFDAGLSAVPTTNVADSPTGLRVDLRVPQSDNPAGTATAHLKDTTVVLPEGMAINPSGANGLDGCSPAQIGLATGVGKTPIRFNGEPAGCPDASRIGSAKVDTPLLDHPIDGSVYVATPHQNPFGSLLAIYIVLDDPETGTLIKLAGEVNPDPETGQLTTTVKENPQLPFSDFELEFFGGADAPLTTPQTCGAYATQSVLTSWARPGQGVESQSGWQITRGPGSECQSAQASMPHAPGFDAGTRSPIAGAYSPFVVDLRRADGTQRFRDVTVKPPPGLTAKLAGTPYCSEQAIQAAGSRSGRAEQASPSCPAASEIGDVFAAAGSGPEPYWAPGKAYLAGPYKGAPLSMAIMTPAVAGPFDLGTIVVRTALHVDERTTEITAVSDSIPRILEGIPLNVRRVSVRLNKPDFTINPTSCDPMRVEGGITSILGQTIGLSDRFQVGECARLGFKPRLRARILDRGRRSTLRSFNPRTRFVVSPRPGDANIGAARVALPSSTILDQSNLDTTCTRAQMAAEDCPAGSIVGYARAWTPLLGEPVQGPVYLAANGGVRPLPDIVAVLDGQVRVSLLGEISTLRTRGKARLQNTFRVVPDAPVSRFVLTMRGGKDRGLLVNSEDLCRSRERGVAVFRGQNGRQARQRLRVGTSFKGCKRVRKQAARRMAKRKAASRKKARQARASQNRAL